MFIFKSSQNFLSLTRAQNQNILFRRWVNVDTQLSAEDCFMKGMEFIQDPTQKRLDLGRQYLQAGAERGSLDAAHSLASFDINSALEGGLSTGKETIKVALSTISNLCDQGHIPSLKLLAQFYSVGLPDVLEKNLDQSIELLEKLTQISLKTGINHKMPYLEETTFAYIFLRDMYYAKGDIENAYRCLSVTYQLGEVRSIYYLSVWFATGRHPQYVEKNLKKSYELCKISAESKHVPAMHDLAVKYLNGDGCGRDIEEAVRYFELASQANYIPSKYNLALLFADGNLIESDIPRALILLSEITSSPQKGFDDLKVQCRELASKLQATIE